MDRYDTPQRATIVLEHPGHDEPWYVVAYLVRDNGARERATLKRCASRQEAAEVLKGYWDKLTAR